MSYYEQNLKALAARQPELVEMIKGPMDTSHMQVLPSESGSPTAEVTGADGKKILIHDRHDPRAGAREHVSTFDLSGNNGSVLLGFGLGYLALEMVESMDEGHLLIICESDPALFKVALTEVDLEPVLRSVFWGLSAGRFPRRPRPAGSWRWPASQRSRSASSL